MADLDSSWDAARAEFLADLQPQIDSWKNALAAELGRREEEEDSEPIEAMDQAEPVGDRKESTRR